MSEIYFIRHGQASFGADDYDQLSRNGIRQAEILACFLDAQGVDFDAIYSGTMKRQKDTAEPVCRRLGARHPQSSAPSILEAFDEYNSEALIKARIRKARARDSKADQPTGDLRRDQKVFQAYFSETVELWMSGAYDDAQGVEPWPRFCRRVNQGVDQIMAEQGSGKRLAVFTSGGPISAVVKNALDLSDRKTAEISWQVQNASITCLKYNPRKLSLTVFNNTTHLLIEGDPSLLTYR